MSLAEIEGEISQGCCTGGVSVHGKINQLFDWELFLKCQARLEKKCFYTISNAGR